MNRVFIESPCFGFGPISTSLALANSLQKKYEIWFITYGESLLFLQKNNDYRFHEIDTRELAEFDRIKAFASHRDLFITNTNVEFSTYLIRQGYKVVVIDTLYWMWNDVPELYSNYDYLIVQKYYGKSVKQLPCHRECRPIINYEIWGGGHCSEKRSTLISFGGMAEPGDSTYIVSSAWEMIRCIHDSLPEDITDVYVVGGLFDSREALFQASRIHVLGCIDTFAFNALVRQSAYVFLSPGLTSLYELLYSQKFFCLLPGLNVSQVYQVAQFSEECGYAHCIQWPDAKKLIDYFNSVPELEGINHLRNYVCSRNIRDEVDFRNGVDRYIEAVDSKRYSFDQAMLSGIFGSPAVEDIVTEYLERLTDE